MSFGGSPASFDSPSGASLRGPHRLAAAGTCERLWTLRYHLYYRMRRDKVYRLLGTLVHVTRQYYFASLMPDPPAWFHAEALEQSLERQCQGRRDLVRVALENLAHYVKWVEARDEKFQPLALEEEFTVQIGELDPGGPHPELDNEVVSVRTDAVLENSDGLWINDTKSLGRSMVSTSTGLLKPWDPVRGQFTLDFQVLMNLHILRRHYGESRVRGFFVERTTRQMPWDHDRHLVIVPQKAYQDTPRNVRMLVKREREIEAKLARGEAPLSAHYACYTRYGPCDYWDVCSASHQNEMYARLHDEFTQMPEDERRRLSQRLRVIQ